MDGAGAVQKVTVPPAGWPAPLAADAIALYEIVVGSSSVTSYIDYRVSLRGPAGATGATGSTGTDGAPGPAGSPGQGVPAGGAAGQQLKKNSATDYDTSWVSEPFDVTAFYPGVIANGAVILRVPVARAVSFPDDFAGSYAKASAAATAATPLDVQKNGVSVGTIAFALGATTATFITSGTAVTLAAGDVLSVHGPATADATLANVGVVLAGTR